jgi:hypothetical protein
LPDGYGAEVVIGETGEVHTALLYAVVTGETEADSELQLWEVQTLELSVTGDAELSLELPHEPVHAHVEQLVTTDDDAGLVMVHGQLVMVRVVAELTV